VDNYDVHPLAHVPGFTCGLLVAREGTFKNCLIFAVRAATALAAFAYPGHIVDYAPSDALSCRLVSHQTSRLCLLWRFLKVSCFLVTRQR